METLSIYGLIKKEPRVDGIGPLLRNPFWREGNYKVELDVFEGPLDLLLYLIKKNEIDIYDIPIAEITRQYLSCLEIMRILDLEMAGEFLVMAATLMRIKAKMLLPSSPIEEEEEFEDPREELVRKLLEYQHYKEISKELSELEDSQRGLFFRSVTPLDGEDKDESIIRPTLFDLLASFKRAMENAPRSGYHEVEPEDVSIEERMEFITNLLKEKEKVSFFEIISGERKLVIIVTFMAILELVKMQKIFARQSVPYGDLWIYQRN